MLNVTYPLIPDEVRAFCAGKRAVLDRRGRPAGIHRAELNTILRRADLQTRIVGKEMLPRAGEYTGQVVARRRGEIPVAMGATACCGAR